MDDVVVNDQSPQERDVAWCSSLLLFAHVTDESAGPQRKSDWQDKPIVNRPIRHMREPVYYWREEERDPDHDDCACYDIASLRHSLSNTLSD